MPASRWSMWFTPPSPWKTVSGSTVSTASGRNVADLAHELLAQREVVGEGAVGLVEERDRRRSPRPRPPPAARASRSAAELERIGPPVVGAGVAAGAAHEPAGGPLVDPAGGGRGGSEVGVVGVRDDHHEPRRDARRGASGGAVSGMRAASRCAARFARLGRGAANCTDDLRSMVLDSRPRLRSSPPTGEALFRARRTAPAWLAVASRRGPRGRLEGLQDLLGVAVGLDVGPGLRDPPVGADQEARPDRSPCTSCRSSVFSRQAPYASATAWSSSDSSVNGRPNFARNAAWLPDPSGLMPQISASWPSMSPWRSRNWQASVVQPGVSSSG